MTLVSLSSIIWLVRRHKLRPKYSILWLSVGVVLTVLAASPSLLDRLSRAVGIIYGPATFFLGAIGLLFFVVIHLSWEVSRLEERTRTLAEEVAILKTVPDAAVREASDGDERRPRPKPTGRGGPHPAPSSPP